jgi:hypothetical protein
MDLYRSCFSFFFLGGGGLSLLVLKLYLVQSKLILLNQFMKYPSRAPLSSDRFIEGSIATPYNIDVHIVSHV